MSDHKVLLAIPNPFQKRYPYEPTGPQLLWLTRQRGYDDGRGIPTTHYLLLFYKLDGSVKYHFEFNVFDRKHAIVET